MASHLLRPLYHISYHERWELEDPQSNRKTNVQLIKQAYSQLSKMLYCLAQSGKFKPVTQLLDT